MTKIFNFTSVLFSRLVAENYRYGNISLFCLLLFPVFTRVRRENSFDRLREIVKNRKIKNVKLIIHSPMEDKNPYYKTKWRHEKEVQFFFQPFVL